MLQDDRLLLKEQFINYLKAVPSFRFASMSIHKNEDTTRLWRKEDPEFSELCDSAIAEFVNKTLKRTKPEFQLERLFKKEFAQRSELTDGEGNPLPILGSISTHVIPKDPSDTKTSEPEKENTGS